MDAEETVETLDNLITFEGIKHIEIQHHDSLELFEVVDTYIGYRDTLIITITEKE